jgi:hypothetical protein
MKCIQDIYEAIENGGLNASALHLIDEYVNEIENGSTDLPRFNQQEHSGLCKAGSALIGASVIASYAARSLTAGSYAGSSQNGPSSWEIEVLEDMHPANVFIDEVSSRAICIDCIVKFAK